MSKQNILIVSNGFGEDQIACKLARAFQENDPKVMIKAVPLVGAGHEYVENGITPLVKHTPLPSGGFIRSFKHLKDDLKAGIIGRQLDYRRIIKESARTADLTVAVGDIYCLGMAAKGNKSPIYFLPTAKSDRFMPHTGIERLVMKRSATHVFPRDQETAEGLLQKGVTATFLGNPMFDDLLGYKPSFDIVDGAQVIGLLPGSRQEGYANLAQCCDVITDTKIQNVQWVAALAASITIDGIQEQFKESSWQYQHDKQQLFHTQTGTIITLTHDFKGLLNRADGIIGLAGTANEQAAYLNKPIFSFVGTGPQASKKRFLEQSKLLGEPMYFCDESSLYALSGNLRAWLERIKLGPESSPTDEQISNASETVSAAAAIVATIMGPK